jgi:hypothetical protein
LQTPEFDREFTDRHFERACHNAKRSLFDSMGIIELEMIAQHPFEEPSKIVIGAIKMAE